MKQNYIESLFSLEGKTIVLTGAGGKLVGEMAFASAMAGAQTIILDLSFDAARRTAARIGKYHGKALPLQCDVLNKSQLEQCCEEIMERYGSIDGWVNGAGGNRMEATASETLSFFEIPLDAHRNVMDLNFTGTLLPCQVFGKIMAEQKRGSVINIASVAGNRPLTRASAYAASKAAVINFTKWLAVYMAGLSPEIRVNAIAPGFFATDQNRYLLFNKSGQVTPRGKSILNNVPFRRFGNPSELASAAIFLLSDSSGFVTGSVITADGGFDAFAGV